MRTLTPLHHRAEEPKQNVKVGRAEVAENGAHECRDLRSPKEKATIPRRGPKSLCKGHYMAYQKARPDMGGKGHHKLVEQWLPQD